MNIGKLLAAIAALMVLALLSSCASTTSLTAVWKDQAYQGPVKKVVVMGVAKQQSMRNIFEDEFVKELRARKIDAVASYTLIPFPRMADKDLVASTIKSVGADALLVTRLVDRKVVETYVPGAAYPGYYYSWRTYNDAYYSMGTVSQDEYVYLETNVYQAATEKLIWSARAETWVVQSNHELIISFIKLIVQKLSADRIIG